MSKITMHSPSPAGRGVGSCWHAPQITINYPDISLTHRFGVMDKLLLDRIIQVLLPVMDDPAVRKALIESALYGSTVLPGIDWSGAARSFTVRLVRQLDEYGEIEANRPTLVALLDALKQQVGEDRKFVLDDLIDELLASRNQEDGSTPTPVRHVLPPPSSNPRTRDHIFISYAHINRAFVDRLAEDLRRSGYIVWIDFEGIRGGDVWRQSIVDGISASAVVLVVITSDSLKSEWVALEVQTARDSGKLLIPLMLEKLTDPRDRAAYTQLNLEAVQYRDFTVGYDLAIQELRKDLPPAKAGLPGYCQKLIARLAQASWGLDHYIQEEARLLPIYASPYDEGVKRTPSENLLGKLWESRRTIILGEPGMGKSVALERLAWELANNNPPIVPILLMLREYDGTALLDWIRLKLLENGDETLRGMLVAPDDVRHLLNTSPYGFYILLDGLNEVRAQHREKLVQEIVRFSLEYGKFPMVVSSRVQDESWRDLREGSFKPEVVVIQPITELQAQMYLAAHLEEIGAVTLWQGLDARMRGLISTPLLLWMLKEAWLESRERIPGNRGELYSSFISRMLRRDDDRKLNTGIAREVRMDALEQLALAMHREKVISLKSEQVKTIISDPQILRALFTNGLLQGEEEIRFAPHQTIQEHFAARALEDQVIRAAQTGFVARMARRIGFSRDTWEYARDPWWWETFVQLAGLTQNSQRLLLELADINPWLAWFCYEESGKYDRVVRERIGNRSYALLYSSNVGDRRSAVNGLVHLQTSRAKDYLAQLSVDADAGISRTALQALINMGEEGITTFLKVFPNRMESLSIAERAAWGDAVHEIDPRPGVGLGADGLPEIEWISIPDDGVWIYQDQKHPGLPAFEIARYPITHIQFQAFLEDDKGFRDSRWWTGLADDEYRRKNQKQVEGQGFEFWNRPRERVSWYDSIAFCRWWSWRLRGGFDLDKIETWAVRLPTEQEWEKAARGTDGRIFPYDNKFDPVKGNTDETEIGQTSAVGIFPKGASPYGVLDMSGNVWEWCLTYANPSLVAEKENLYSSNRRALRGGSWNLSQDYARAVSRYGYSPYYRTLDIGFRVVRPPSLTH